jgi:hypothetical protein
MVSSGHQPQSNHRTVEPVQEVLRKWGLPRSLDLLMQNVHRLASDLRDKVFSTLPVQALPYP